MAMSEGYGKRRMRYFSVRNDVPEWRVQLVPTVQLVEQVLDPLHYRRAGKHCRTLKTLRKALINEGYVEPVEREYLWRNNNITVARILIKALYRYLHDCNECFLAFHEGCQWEQATALAEQKRSIICSMLKLVHVAVPDDYCGCLLGLGQPVDKGCVSNLAEGGGKCWFSSIFYLLVGKKSG